MKSKLTIAELRAQAMLLGMRYDYQDHTFFIPLDLTDPKHEFVEYDADTLERVSGSSVNSWLSRKHRVGRGEIGAKDYGPSQVPYDGQDD